MKSHSRATLVAVTRFRTYFLQMRSLKEITHNPAIIKTQAVNHNILGSPTQMCDAALLKIILRCSQTSSGWPLAAVPPDAPVTQYRAEGGPTDSRRWGRTC